jgi:hypothetical protein
MTRAPYTYDTGKGKNRVVVYADPKRGGTLYLRWRDRTTHNWARKALGRVIELDGRGKITADCESFAIGAAQQKSLELASGITAPAAQAEKAPLTIAGAEALITNPDAGKYPHKSPFRDELVRALRLAVVLWGAETPWTAIDEAHYTMLLRRRLEALIAGGFSAVRATEITVSRIITTVRWLRRMRHIPRDAAPWPDEWKLEVTRHWKGVKKTDRDPQPNRPRYTLEEYQRILSKADFDPRLFMLLRLSVGLRPGQVARARRSDLELPPVDWQAPIERDEKGRDPTDYGVLNVYGAGKKGGAMVDLTRGQRFTVEQALTGDGYLARMDAKYQTDEIDDYVLFPTGYIVGRVGMIRGKETKLTLSEFADFTKHVTGSWIRKSWRTAEERAGIAHEIGRATYGGRRLGVDVGDEMELSPSGLQGLGGWSDIKIPTSIYRERGNKAGRREARPVRARLLGEIE